MKKVLQISKYYYPFIGGTEQVAKDIANALKGEAFEQKIICFNEDAAMEDAISYRKETKTDYIDGIEVIRCGCICKVASQSISLTYGNVLKRVMKDFQPDIVVLHYPNPFTTQLLLKYKKMDFRLYVYWHLDITKQKRLKKMFHKQNLDLIERADYILGSTPKHVNESEYTPYFKDKKYILPYAIDENRLVLSDEESKKADWIRNSYDGQILCFFIGRHVPYKGLEYLIEASAYVDENVKFLIAGSGELTEQLKEKAKGNEKIEFLGRISDSEWRSYLKACDIFCFPSITRNEGFGLALAEGMYYGKPAVTFTIPGSGVNYVNLNGITGIECPNRDSVAYGKAINRLAKDNNLREQYGKNARQRVEDNFTFIQFKQNVIRLFEKD